MTTGIDQTTPNTAPYFRAPCFFSRCPDANRIRGATKARHLVGLAMRRPGLKLQPASLPVEFVPQQVVVNKLRLARLDLLEAAIRQRGLAPKQQGPR